VHLHNQGVKDTAFRSGSSYDRGNEGWVQVLSKSLVKAGSEGLRARSRTAAIARHGYQPTTKPADRDVTRR